MHDSIMEFDGIDPNSSLQGWAYDTDLTHNTIDDWLVRDMCLIMD